MRRIFIGDASKWIWPLAILLLLFPLDLFGATQTKKMKVVPKWGRFEQSFKSSVAYSNALQEATLTAVFTSPLGETNQVYGFWDGAKTWRVRFSPNQPGRWLFRTICSDGSNQGLHNQQGEFTCTAATGQNRFNQHGPVRVARDRRHFEHADGTPFFWLADTVWSGPLVAHFSDWDFYAKARSAQQFTVAQWTVAPGQDRKKQTAFAGSDSIVINPEFFQRLDAKVDTLNRAGILSAIVPLSELVSQTDSAAEIPGDQVALLFRYIVARWGADPVAWLLCPDGANQRTKTERWKKIGHAVFGEARHAPVVLYAGEGRELLDRFRDQNWVDVFGYETAGDLAAQGFANEWQKEPIRPLIPFAPCENGINPRTKKRFGSDEVRRAIYWSLLLAPPAGVSYGGEGVMDWDERREVEGQESEVSGQRPDDLPAWHKALFMPAAKQMKYLAKLMGSVDFWRLRPQPNFLASQPSGSSQPPNVAAGSEAKDLSLIYLPQDRTLEIFLAALPASPSIGWFNPRTGENSPAVAVVGGQTCQFPTPDPGDWLLGTKTSK